MALRVVAFSLLLAAASHVGAAVSPSDLARHIDVLASDALEGREPGTEGERKSIDYIADQWQAIGLQPAGDRGGWLQEVKLVTRAPLTQKFAWKAGLRKIRLHQSQLLLLGSGETERIKT